MRKLYLAIDSIKCQDTRLRLFGWYFGFPACCVKQFVEEFDSVVGQHTRDDDERRLPMYVRCAETHPWVGTGFIPCTKCVPAARADFPRFIAERILPNRQHPEPFPKDRKYDERHFTTG